MNLLAGSESLIQVQQMPSTFHPHAQCSQLTSLLIERNDEDDRAACIENPNFTGAKASTVLCVVDCLLFL